MSVCVLSSFFIPEISCLVPQVALIPESGLQTQVDGCRRRRGHLGDVVVAPRADLDNVPLLRRSIG